MLCHSDKYDRLQFYVSAAKLRCGAVFILRREEIALLNSTLAGGMQKVQRKIVNYRDGTGGSFSTGAICLEPMASHSHSIATVLIKCTGAWNNADPENAH